MFVRRMGGSAVFEPVERRFCARVEAVRNWLESGQIWPRDSLSPHRRSQRILGLPG